MISRRGPRITRAPRASRVPIATSLCPDSSGASNGSSAFRSVDRSTSMYAKIAASLCDQTDLQRATAAGALQAHRAHAIQRGFQSQRLGPRSVITCVVRDRDPRRERELRAQERMQPPHARAQVTLLVADRDHDVNGGAAGRQGLPVGERRGLTQQ